MLLDFPLLSAALFPGAPPWCRCEWEGQRREVEWGIPFADRYRGGDNATFWRYHYLPSAYDPAKKYRSTRALLFPWLWEMPVVFECGDPVWTPSPRHHIQPGHCPGQWILAGRNIFI